MSIHDLLNPNVYDIYANTLTVASGVIPPPSSAPTFTVGPPGPLTVNGATNLNGGLTLTGNSSIGGSESVAGDFSVGGNITGVAGTSNFTGAVTTNALNVNGAQINNNNLIINPPFQLTGDVFYNNAVVSPNTLFEAGIGQVQDALDRIQSYSPRALAQSTLTTPLLPLPTSMGPIPTTFQSGLGASRPQSNIAAYWTAPGGGDGIQGSFASYGATVAYKMTALLESNALSAIVGDPASLTVSVFANGVPVISNTAIWDEVTAGNFHVSTSGTIITSFNTVFTVQGWVNSAGAQQCQSCILYIEYDGDM